jgi:bifunctional non-homologous end joining protein LigD
MLRHLQQRLESLRRPTAPAAGVPREDDRHARWVEPVLVGEVVFRTCSVDRTTGRHAEHVG